MDKWVPDAAAPAAGPPAFAGAGGSPAGAPPGIGQTYPDSGGDQPQKSQPAAQQAKNRIDWGGQLIGGALQAVAAYIQGGAAAVRQSLAQLASSLISQMIPGPIGAGLGAIAGALIGGRHRPVVVEKIIDPVKIDTESLSFAFSANPSSAGFGGRLVHTGGAFTVEIGFTDGADDVLAAKVAGSFYNENRRDGYAGAYA